VRLKQSLLVALTLLFAASAICAPTPAKLSKELALKAIVLFRNDPQSDFGRAAAAYIFDFVEKSPDVNVVVSSKTVPFLGDKSLPQDVFSTLLAAYAVGNADPQLLRARKKNDSYAGVRQVIDTYRQLQKRSPKLKVPQVEKFIELEKSGKLKEHVSSP
jgi:hypothetical protein